jgi:hypothetical protein
LRRGAYIIIGGVAILIAGIGVAAVGFIPIMQKLYEENQVLTNEPIDGGSTKTLTVDVGDTSRQLSAVISTTDSNVPLRAVLKGPDASVISDTSFRSNTLLGAKPTSPGLYALLITNQGDTAATINVVFGYLPGVGQNNQVNGQLFAVPIVGGLMVVTGFIVIIIGIVIALVDRRPKSIPSAAA